MITVRMTGEAARPKLADGSENPLWVYIIEAQSWGVEKLRREGDSVFLDGITDTKLFDLDELKAIIGGAVQLFGAGAVEVLNYPVWLEAESGSAGVPVYVPVDDIETEGDSRRPTVAELRMAREVDGKWYAPLSDGVTYFDASISVRLDSEEGFAIVAKPPEVEVQE